MGTSMNQRSPRTTNWRAVEAVYSDSEIPVRRIVQEVWRASVNDEAGLATTLGDPIISRGLGFLQNASSPSEVLENIRRDVALSGKSSLASDIAQRAAVIAFRDENRIQSYIHSVFIEASNYLVSRDLPGYIGLTNRLKTVKNITSFKSEIFKEVSEKVSSVPQPTQKISDQSTWNSYVTNVVKRLIREE